MQEELAKFEVKAGFKIRQELLAGLAGPMVYYTLPAGVMMGAPGAGMVLIADLKDGSRLEKSLIALGNFAATESEGMLQVSSQKVDGRIIHSWMIAPLAMMQIMPC